MKKYISLLLATAATIACTKVALEDNSPIESLPQDGNTENVQGEPSGEKIIISLAETKVSLDENGDYQFDGDEVIYVKARTTGAVAKLQKSADEKNTFTGVFNGLLGETSETFDFYYNCTDENANVVTDEKKVQNGQPWLAATGVPGYRSEASEYSYVLNNVMLKQLDGYVCLALNSDYECTVDFHTLSTKLPKTTITGIQLGSGSKKPYFVNIKSGMTGGFYLTVTYEGQKMYTSYGTTAEITSNQIIKTKDFEAFSISGQLVDDESRTFQSTYNVYRNSGADAANGIKSDFISSGEATFTMTGISKTIRNLVSLKKITVTFNDKVSASVEPTTPTTPDWTETKSCTIKIPQTYGHNKWGPITVLNAEAVFSTPDGNDYQVSFANPSITRHITGLPYKKDFTTDKDVTGWYLTGNEYYDDGYIIGYYYNISGKNYRYDIFSPTFYIPKENTINAKYNVSVKWWNTGSNLSSGSSTLHTGITSNNQKKSDKTATLTEKKSQQSLTLSDEQAELSESKNQVITYIDSASWPKAVQHFVLYNKFEIYYR